MASNCYFKSKYNSFIYFGGFNLGEAVYFLLYVTYILITNRNKYEIRKVKGLLSGEFKMKDLGSIKRIVGMELSYIEVLELFL